MTINVQDISTRGAAWNAGGLPSEISIEQLKKAHPSISRNPLIADVRYRAGYIDTRGRGINKILSACREYGLDDPQFEDVFGGLRVTLAGGRSKASSETVAKKGSEKILMLLVENSSLSAKDLAEAVGMSFRAVEKQLSILKNIRTLETHWTCQVRIPASNRGQ